jgi:serine/threonine protein kinase
MQPGRQASGTTDLLLGKVLGERFQLVRRIGAGGMGAVYEARDTESGKRAAVKVLNRELAQDTTLLERFRREASITASLSNPHTIKVFGFEEPDDGPPYMVMEFLDGEDLETRLKRERRLTPQAAQEVLRGLSIALTEAHRAGVVHRDLKPANIFYAQEGVGERVKLLDFGLSKAMKLQGEGLTSFGQILGTVWYMSPEQTRGGEATALSDVYALGVVLYQALTGELPFQAATPYEYLFRIQTAAPRPLAEVAPDLPPGVEGILFRAMAREPADLFALGSEQTSMVRAPVSPRQRSTPAMPKIVTDPKMRAGARPLSNAKIPMLVPAKMASDPNLRVPKDGAPQSNARAVMPLPEPEPTEYAPPSDATVVRPMMAPAAEGEDGTYVPQKPVTMPPRPVMPPAAEGEDGTYVRRSSKPEPLPEPDPEPVAEEVGATRVTMAPVAPPALPAVPRASLRPVPVLRPITDPDEGPPERTVPGGPTGQRPIRPKRNDDHTPREARPAVHDEAEAGDEAEASSTNPLMLGLGIGAGLGVLLLIVALVMKFMH